MQKPVHSTNFAVQSFDVESHRIIVWTDNPNALNEFGNVIQLSGNQYVLTVDRRYPDFNAVLEYIKTLGV